MLGYLFAADLEVDKPLEKSKNLYFCEALTAGIRGGLGLMTAVLL